MAAPDEIREQSNRSFRGMMIKATNAEGKTESKNEKFKRLAEKRTNGALKRIEQLGNLAGPSYDYDTAQAQQIMDALFNAVQDCRRRFEKAKARKSGKSGFTFKDVYEERNAK